MIIDYIQVEKLPTIIVWFDWIIYAHKKRLLGSIFALIVHFLFTADKYSFGSFTIAVFCGICWCCFYTLITDGYGVG